METVYVIDDKNIEGDSLSRRRLKLLASGARLKELTKAIFGVADLIKLSKAKTWLIDSKGTLFKYKKEKHHSMLSKKIVKRFNIPTGGSIIEVEGISSRFKTLFTVPEEHDTAILLSNNKISYTLFGTESSDNASKLTRRKV